MGETFSINTDLRILLLGAVLTVIATIVFHEFGVHAFARMYDWSEKTQTFVIILFVVIVVVLWLFLARPDNDLLPEFQEEMGLHKRGNWGEWESQLSKDTIKQFMELRAQLSREDIPPAKKKVLLTLMEDMISKFPPEGREKAKGMCEEAKDELGIV